MDVAAILGVAEQGVQRDKCVHCVIVIKRDGNMYGAAIRNGGFCRLRVTDGRIDAVLFGKFWNNNFPSLKKRFFVPMHEMLH